jgi:hypothetical protein
MKLRNLILATIVLLALAGTLYWSDHKKSSEDTSKVSADTAPPVLKIDEAAVTKLELKKKDATPIVLSKADSTAWRIIEPQSYEADQSAVSGLLSSLSPLNSDRVVEDKASDLKQYGLDPPVDEVDVTTKDNKTQKLLIGDDTPTGSAVYTKLGSDPRVFTIASYRKTSFDKSLNDLRDKRLITATPDSVSRVELSRKNETIEFGRNKDEWQILKPKPLRADSFQVSELVRKLTDARMDLSGSDTKDAAPDYAHGTPVATAKVTDQSGTQEIQVRKDKDSYFAKSSVVAGVYKVNADLGQALDKGLEDFRNRKIFDFGYTDPDKIELHIDSGAYFLTKGGNDWWGANGKKLDAGSTDELVSHLRDLTASKFTDTGFANPSIEISVTPNGGKHVEKVSIAKSGDEYIAKRQDDPSLYVLSANSIDELKKDASAVKPASGK